MPHRPLALLLSCAVLLASAACGGEGGDGLGDDGIDVPGGGTGGGGETGGGSGEGGETGGIADGGTSGGGGGGTGTVVDGGTRTCLASNVLTSLGKTDGHLLVGARTAEATASQAPFDFRYLYLAGGLFTSSEPCTSCSAQCSTAWWGCWQDPAQPPGKYVRDFVSRNADRGQLSMITYYEQLHGSGAQEGTPQVQAMTDVTQMHRYFADWRFLLQQLAGTRAILHVEPDLWGYMQHLDTNPAAIPVAVASANSTDCADQPNTAVGFGRCLVKMARAYAPNAKIGFHASAWATKRDVAYNTDPSFNVAAEAQKVADYLLAVGADQTDFVVIEASDRDAGYYQSLGRNRWWDATNTTLPTFHQAFGWARALTERMQKPSLWWQLPVGNTSLPDVIDQWRDNRVEYFFAHPAEVAATNAFGMAFGSGATGQTTPETDNGLLITKTKAYSTKPQLACAE